MTCFYVRESTKEQAENGFNLQDQIRKIKAYVEVYAEQFTTNQVLFEEFGASAKTLNRPQMNRLIKAVKDNEVGFVIIHNLDRLTRRVKDLVYLLELFEEHEVKLISLTEKIDTSTAQGQFFVYLTVLLAQFEQDQIGERTTRGLYSSAKEMNYAKSKVPIGYIKENKKLLYDKNCKEAIDELFELLVQGVLPISCIVMKINKKYTMKLTSSKVKNMINNDIYAGRYVDKSQVIENHSPAYITWNQLQYIRMTHYNRKHLNSLVGYDYYNFVFCNDCGSHMQHHTTIKNGCQRFYYYYCEKCKKRINQKIIREPINKVFNSIIVQEGKERQLKKMSKLVESNYNDIKLLNEAYKYECIKKSPYEAKTTLAMNEIKDLKSKITELKSDIIDVIKYENMTFLQKQTFLLNHVYRIYVDTNSKTTSVELLKK